MTRKSCLIRLQVSLTFGGLSYFEFFVLYVTRTWYYYLDSSADQVRRIGGNEQMVEFLARLGENAR